MVIYFQLISQQNFLYLNAEDDIVELFNFHDLPIDVVTLKFTKEVDALVGQAPPVLLELVEVLEQHHVLILYEESGVALLHDVKVIK